jgi:hypothetical protein
MAFPSYLRMLHSVVILRTVSKRERERERECWGGESHLGTCSVPPYQESGSQEVSNIYSGPKSEVVLDLFLFSLTQSPEPIISTS